MRDPDSRYHGYWATACVDCGPRFTVIDGLPYDRPETSMAAFPMCEDCAAEYEDPSDRRYHAQTIACPDCGPTIRYFAGDVSTPRATGTEGRDPFPAGDSEPARGRPSITDAAAAIADGAIVVIKGIGGAHLACSATDAAAVQRLRERTDRPAKPFALMAPTVEAVRGVARVSEVERAELTSPRRPILLLESRDDTPVAAAVAPGLHTVGVMLPYSGVHYLLFDHLDGPLVMTSANVPGRPMSIENSAIVEGLDEVADGYLLHDRRIVARCDDSVARVIDGERRLIRRSRGFAPTPVPLGRDGPTVLGLGPELDVTAGVSAGDDCYLTQYVGDVDTVETFEYLTNAVEHLQSITGVGAPTVVAHDRHPDFRTTGHAKELVRQGTVDERVAVQHHHAHAASVLSEHDLDTAVAITVDGVGYGPDGTVWGGEVLDATVTDYERVGGLAPMPMPGGDQATRRPGRMAAGILHRARPEAVEAVLERHDVPFPGGPDERDIVCQQLAAEVNVTETTSAGRFLDAVSAFLGVCEERRYEGEPAMKLEAVAADGEPQSVALPFKTVDGRDVLDTPAFFDALVERRETGASRSTVAATAQAGLADGLAHLAVEVATDRDRDVVALSGGVAYNDHIAGHIRRTVEAAGLQFVGNRSVPPGDGGIAYGQIAVAVARSE